MKKATLAGLVVLAFSLGVLAASQTTARAEHRAAAPVVTEAPAAAVPAPVLGTDAEPLAKKCSFNSDCPYGKCKGGACGGCDFNSDCKGWGKCKGGSCGACDFSSDCKDFGGCSGGRCGKSPY